MMLHAFLDMFNLVNIGVCSVCVSGLYKVRMKYFE